MVGSSPNRRLSGKGVGVILFSRHILTPEPAIPLQQFAMLGQEAKPGVSTQEIPTETGFEKIAVFHAPEIVEEYRRKLEAGWYQKRLREIEDWQSVLSDLSFHAIGYVEGDVSGVCLKIRAEAALENDAWDRIMDNDGAQKMASLLDRFAALFFAGPDGKPHLLLPEPFSLDRVFTTVLEEVDADFLLSGFDQQTRKSLDRLALRWSRTIDQFVEEKFGPRQNMSEANVKALVREELKSTFDEHVAKALSWAAEARLAFYHDRKLVVRAVIENMQRLVLHQLPAIPIAVETSSGILQRWRKLLRTILNSRLGSLTGRVHDDRKPFYTPDFGIDVDIEELRDVVRPLRGDVEKQTYRAFFDRVRQMEREDEALWQGVIQKLAGEMPSFGWESKITKGLRLCGWVEGRLAAATFSPDLFKKLRRVFAES